MNSVLVTGGAGYIGSIMVQALRRAGYRTVVFDNLSDGHEAAVKHEELVEGDLLDRNAVRTLLRRHRPTAIMHFAAVCSVKESVENPFKYYATNVTGTANLLEAALEVGVPRFIFSSTAALYGEPEEVPITESHPLRPINPYGWSKLFGEQMLADAAKAYGIRYVAFRYFNAAGADPTAGLGEDHDPETHLIPLAIRAALSEDRELIVFGDDYPTRDGSCIRDYIHVLDLAEAHLLGLKYLEGEGESVSINLGTEAGTSVLEIVNAVGKAAGTPVSYRVAGRRAGDPAVLIASSGKAREVLGWTPKHDLDDMIASAYEFIRRHPDGYPDGPSPADELAVRLPQPEPDDSGVTR